MALNHPELLIVPALMMADYFLTIAGAKSASAVYRKHFVMPTYELNPAWRRSIDQRQWFNPRHAILVLVMTAILVLLDQLDVLPFESFEILLGMFLGIYGSVCGRHLTNLLIFYYINRHPDQVSGQVRLSLSLITRISQFNHVGLIPLFSIVVLLVPTRFTYGVLVGLLAIVVLHFGWSRRAEALDKQTQQPIVAELAETDGPD